MGNDWFHEYFINELKAIGRKPTSSMQHEVVDSLPSSGNEQIIYFVKNDSSSSNNHYDEYVWISSSSTFEKIGSTQIDAGGATTLHINVTAVNMETMQATFTADKTPSEMTQAAVNGPVWCVVTIAAGLMGKDAVSIGLPPAWLSSTPAFGSVISYVHDAEGYNKIGYAVRADSAGWVVDLTQFGG